jgi:aconitate hydratase
VPVRALRKQGRVEAFECAAAVETRLEVERLLNGGVIPTILNKHLPKAST